MMLFLKGDFLSQFHFFGLGLFDYQMTYKGVHGEMWLTVAD